MDLAAAFDDAFSDPTNTALNTDDSRVNAVIQEHYEVDKPFTYTRTLLWDMEVKKAYYPDKYIRHVVRPGSLRTFNHTVDSHLENFIRITDQMMWKDHSKYSTVVENVSLNYKTHEAVFIGLPEAITPEGEKITTGREQPIFHVKHCAVGPEDDPVNTWRIVHLTDKRDESLVEIFQKIGSTSFLRLFNEVYIRDDLGRTLIRRGLERS